MYAMIPSKISVGAQDIFVIKKERLESDDLGECCVAEGRINIARTFNGKNQSESVQINTFYHELVHVILDTMHENELSRNEKFVSCFSSFLCEAMKNAYFDESK